MRYFFDTSALTKRYITEKGSTAVRALVHPAAGNFVFIAEITPVEIMSAVIRQRREGAISQETVRLYAQ